MKFNGDIVITDPCYLSNEYGMNRDLSKHGFTNYINGPTLYGDWSCTTFKVEKDYINSKKILASYAQSVAKGDIEHTYNEVLGEFCADGGEVCVVYRDEALSWNKDFETHSYYKDSYFKENGEFVQGTLYTGSIYDYFATLIKNFKGEVEFHDFYNGGFRNRIVVGYGNKNFYTLQTGL